jgi:hypothetical protein
MLSRVKSITTPVTLEALAAAQDEEGELRNLIAEATSLRLQKVDIPGTNISLYCDSSASPSFSSLLLSAVRYLIPCTS